jgi:hypothetical protein
LGLARRLSELGARQRRIHEVIGRRCHGGSANVRCSFHHKVRPGSDPDSGDAVHSIDDPVDAARSPDDLPRGRFARRLNGHTRRVDWADVARRQEERSVQAKGAVLTANAAYGAGLAHLMVGDREAARAWLDHAVLAYRESWAGAPAESWGRPIATIKARLLAGEPAEIEARWALEVGADDAKSPIGHYAAALAHLVLGQDEQAGVHADAIRAADGFPVDVGDAVAAIAAGTDAIAYVEALERVLDSFETRTDYLEDVAVADTVLVLRALGEARGLRAELSSPLLPG